MENDKNCCAKCKYELTCGYSPLATTGDRTECSYEECCLGDMSYGKGSFFKEKEM